MAAVSLAQKIGRPPDGGTGAMAQAAPMTTHKDLITLALQLTDDGDLGGREQLFTEDCEWTVPGYSSRGRAGTSAFSRPMMAAFPDGRHQCDLFVEEGDTVMLEGVWTATHTAGLVTPDGEIPATGRAVRLPFTMVTRFEGDLAASVHVYFDQMAFLAQLGLLPEPAAA
jgi:predicted ester cyclase